LLKANAAVGDSANKSVGSPIAGLVMKSDNASNKGGQVLPPRQLFRSHSLVDSVPPNWGDGVPENKGSEGDKEHPEQRSEEAQQYQVPKRSVSFAGRRRRSSLDDCYSNPLYALHSSPKNNPLYSSPPRSPTRSRRQILMPQKIPPNTW
jgi:hypothetical protein